MPDIQAAGARRSGLMIVRISGDFTTMLVDYPPATIESLRPVQRGGVVLVVLTIDFVQTWSV